MINRLQKLFLGLTLSSIVLGQYIAASQEISLTSDNGMEIENKDNRRKRKLGELTNAEQQKNHKSFAVQQLFSISDVPYEVLTFLNYEELRQFAATNKLHTPLAKGALMKAGAQWISWIKDLPAKSILNEVAGALTRTLHPIAKLSNIIDGYYDDIPYKNRLKDKQQQGDALVFMDIKDDARNELNQLTNGKRRQELLEQLSSYAATWHPYAVAHIMHRLLTNYPFIHPLDVPPTSQLAEQWLTKKISPQVMQEYLRYVHAAHKIMPTLQICLAKNENNADGAIVEQSFANAHRVYESAITYYKDLSFTAEIGTIDDQLITLYQQRIGDIEQVQASSLICTPGRMFIAMNNLDNSKYATHRAHTKLLNDRLEAYQAAFAYGNCNQNEEDMLFGRMMTIGSKLIENSSNNNH